MDLLLKRIKGAIAVSAELEAVIETSFQSQTHEAGVHLIREGQHCRQLFFVESGIVRTYYHHGIKEVTSWFYHENQFFTTWYSFLEQAPSFEAAEVLEKAVVYSITYNQVQDLYRQFPKMEHFGRKLMEGQLSFIDYYSKGYMFLSARERYLLLLDYFPDIELRVKLGHIASFLGISQETLSRIRKK